MWLQSLRMDAIPNGWKQDGPYESWDTLNAALTRLENSSSLACRGDPESYESLIPSLDREFKTHGVERDRRYGIERVLAERFAKYAGVHLDSALRANLEDVMQTWILMRHFGAPTRLLDWTDSIWIAAYFAACSSPEKRGCIWVFDRHRFADAVREAGLEVEVNRCLYTPISPFLRPICLTDRNLKAMLQSPPRPWITTLFQERNTFPRIIAQQGLFTFASRLSTEHDRALADLQKKSLINLSLHRLEFVGKVKPQVLASLARKGITGATLYPDVTGLCLHLRDVISFSSLDDGIRRLVDGHARPLDVASPLVQLDPGQLNDLASHLELAAKQARDAAALLKGKTV